MANKVANQQNYRFLQFVSFELDVLTLFPAQLLWWGGDLITKTAGWFIKASFFAPPWINLAAKSLNFVFFKQEEIAVIQLCGSFRKNIVQNWTAHCNSPCRKSNLLSNWARLYTVLLCLTWAADHKINSPFTTCTLSGSSFYACGGAEPASGILCWLVDCITDDSCVGSTPRSPVPVSLQLLALKRKPSLLAPHTIPPP